MIETRLWPAPHRSSWSFLFACDQRDSGWMLHSRSPKLLNSPRTHWTSPEFLPRFLPLVTHDVWVGALKKSVVKTLRCEFNSSWNSVPGSASLLSCKNCTMSIKMAKKGNKLYEAEMPVIMWMSRCTIKQTSSPLTGLTSERGRWKSHHDCPQMPLGVGRS